MRLGKSRRVRRQSHGVAGSKQIHKSYLQETDGPGFPPLNPAFEPRPVAPPLTETPQPDGRWEAHACALLLGPHLPDAEGRRDCGQRPLEKSSVGAGSGKSSGRPGHLPSCLGPATHFLQPFLTPGSAPA